MRVIADDYVDTDGMMPHRGYDLAPREQALLCLGSVRPGRAAQVRPGDVLVAGLGFLPAVEPPGVPGLVAEGDELSVDVATGRDADVRTGRHAMGQPMAQVPLDVMTTGGTHALLTREGYL